MVLSQAKRRLPMLAVVIGAFMSSPAFALVDLEWRPPSQTVTNGTVFDVDIYAVSDDATDQSVGIVQLVFTWDSTAIELVGHVDSSPYAWQFIGFLNDASVDGLNAPYGTVPGNDGDAMLTAAAPIVGAPASATPAGLLVGTLQFRAIDTTTDTPIVIEAVIGSTTTLVMDARANGNFVTGVLGPPSLVTSTCAADIDCDDWNDCTTDTCNTGASTCSHSAIVVGTACGDPGDTDCDNPDTCDGAGTCVANLELPGVSCGSPINTDCDNPDTCDGTGVCLTNNAVAGTACGDPAETDCDNPDTCDGTGGCLINNEPSGLACGDPSESACDHADTCNGSGACQGNLEPVGSVCGDPTDNACTDPDSCDGFGACLPNDFVCSAPTPFCREIDSQPVCVECLDSIHCDDGNFCTADFCDLANICRNSSDPMDGTPCPDAAFCNGVETCTMGLCLSPGDPCDDDNVCTDDSCSEVTDSCTSTPNNNNDPDDGLFCNGVDTCVGGNIVFGQPPICDDANGCTDDSCDEFADDCAFVNNTLACEDGDPCTIDDACGGGSCQSGSPPSGNGRVDLVWIPGSSTRRLGDPITFGLYAVSVDANPDDMFTLDVVISWDPNFLELLGHDDTSAPNWLVSGFPDDSAFDGLNAPFTGLPSNDGDALYQAWAQLGVPEAATSAGLLITEIQFGTTALTEGTPIDILNCVGMSPTATVVDGGSAGQLQGVLGSTSVRIVECFTSPDCDDGAFCNGTEVCSANACVLGANPCDDDNICTDDSCNEGNDTCFNTPNDNHDPDDGLFCNGVDTCSNGVIIVGAAPDCDDSNVCTDDSCSEAIRDCEYVDNTLTCDDGNGCTDGDACSGGFCSGVVDPDCDPCEFDWQCEDGIACTVDVCNTSLGVCAIDSLDHTFCDDDLFCNGSEYCDPVNGAPVTGCVSGEAPCDPCDEVIGCPCEPPLAEAAGSRYIAIMPQLPDAPSPQALRVTYCAGTFKYVGAPPGETLPLPWDVDPTPLDQTVDGSFAVLVDDPADALYLTPAEWGGIVWVASIDIVPETTYEVQADCGTPGAPSLTLPVPVTTWIFGDTENNGIVNFNDLAWLVNGFQGIWESSEGPTIIPNLDVHGCMPNRVINFVDIQITVAAFQGQTYPDGANCPVPCGP